MSSKYEVGKKYFRDVKTSLLSLHKTFYFMKKIYIVLTLSICIILLQSGVRSVNYSSVPPAGYTGATGSYCVNCHSSFSLNSGGGGVTVTGLVATGYIPANLYPLTIKIDHGAADRKKWGFSMKAVDASGNSVGTFRSTNTNAKRNTNDQGELSHFQAVSTLGGANTYTYNNLTWEAPATALGPITFYYVGNAANGLNGNQFDYIYSGSQTFGPQPIELKAFKAVTDNNTVILKWQTVSEINSNYFDIERSDDGQFFFSIGRLNASGNSSQSVSYSFTDTKLSSNNGSQIFYRLKLVDKDGAIKYSNHLSVKPIITGTSIIKVYPTVIRKNETVTVELVNDKSKTLSVDVMDEAGRKIQQLYATIGVGKSSVYFTPKVDNFKGLLFVRFSTTNFQQTTTLVLQ